MEDTWLSQSHVGTHIDGMGHIGGGDCYYNQTAMGKYINQNNMTRLGLEHLKSFATRGVVIDLVRVYQDAGKLKANPACKSPCLDQGTVITPDDLEAGLKFYNVTLREGDAVFLHTGWGDLFGQYPAQKLRSTTAASRASAPPPPNGWIDKKIVLVGADNWAGSKWPPSRTRRLYSRCTRC